VRHFAALYEALDASTKTNDKLAALTRYFEQVDAESAAWATYFLMGNKLKRTVKSGTLRQAAIAASGLQPWLFESSYEVVGDLAETISLLVLDAPAVATTAPTAAPAPAAPLTLPNWITQRLAPLALQSPEQQLIVLPQYWSSVPRAERFLITKILTGALRVGVSKSTTLKALARVRGLDANALTQRLMGPWQPSPDFYDRIAEAPTGGDLRPYPFLLAYPVVEPDRELGDVLRWQAEWKWDGIRAQIVKREGKVALWSRGEELVDEAFPDVLARALALPDGTALDGELIVWQPQAATPEPFTSLQKRLGRKKPSAKMQAEFPVQLVAYDLLELHGTDLRALPLFERRQRLVALLQNDQFPGIQCSLALTSTCWQVLAHTRSQAREQRAEGLMLKRLDSPYGVGRISGDWWKWKLAPLTVDCVMIYAQAGHGRRAGLYTDFTFAVWSTNVPTGERLLVPFAKAYSGLSDAELRDVDSWIRKNTLERFGPVRSVTPALVFELGFEGLNVSSRHKSGIAVRFPRILRWRRDKPPAEADSLDALVDMLKAQNR
jgi:DNA ligase 1